MTGIYFIRKPTGGSENSGGKYCLAIAICCGQVYNKGNGLHRLLDAKTLLDAR